MAKIYTVFISHSWTYVKDLRKLKNLLENRGYFKVEFEEASPEYPINSENADYIKSVLKSKIKKSDVVLGIAGVYASYSGWMEWELDYALKKDIPIIGVVPRGNERISKVVSLRSKEDIRWNTESIVEAIRKWG